MASIYAEQVERLGRHWHRPWSFFLFIGVALTAMHWLDRWWNDEPTQVVCNVRSGARFKNAVKEDGLYWTADLTAAIECAYLNNRHVLISTEAIFDTNCRFNKITVLREKAVQSELKRYVLVANYLCCVPPEYYTEAPSQRQCQMDGDANLEWQKANLGTEQEPLFVVLQPTGRQTFRVVGDPFEGMIRDRAEFLRFLRDPTNWRRDGGLRFWDLLTHFMKRD